MSDNRTTANQASDRPDQTSNRTDEPQGMVGMLSSLLNDVTKLVSNEIALGKAEIRQNVSKAGNAIASMVVAGAVLQAGFLVLLAAAVFGLNRVLPPEMTPWLSALIVGGVVVIIGASMLKKARTALSKQAMAPDRTIDNLQRDQEMVKEHTGRGQSKERTQ
ncbi:phage holin family protein [Larsenimonas salina]|uniref:phage holin family protein n=1 Tax=Larsenimonas salina TaxID=1295565 RepID=UPI0020735DBD|nr:phage holin family protein [Larsenimonas salina]MCM5704534.1 phage holin family protein [Larsenimonas salina]